MRLRLFEHQFSYYFATGYGDYKPTTPVTQIVFLFYGMAGLGVLSYTLSVFLSPDAVYDEEETTPKDLSYLLRQMTYFIILLLLGGWAFHFSEGWSLTAGIYFAFVTTTTIGYGDQVRGRMACL